MMCSRFISPHILTTSLSLSKPIKTSTFPHLSFSTTATTTTTTVKMSQTIEHIVLFKVNPNTDPQKVTTMINGLNSLTSLTQVLHLSAGPVHKNRSTAFTFTHLLHSRYKSKTDLADYSAHPAHLSVVRESVLPICDDLMAVDWVSTDLEDDNYNVAPNSVMRVSFLKLKEGLGESEKEKVLEVVGGVKDKLGSVGQFTVGENFSPARAKGFSIASIAVFPGLKELEEVEMQEEKEKVRDLLESVIVLDYVVGVATSPPQPASL